MAHRQLERPPLRSISEYEDARILWAAADAREGSPFFSSSPWLRALVRDCPAKDGERLRHFLSRQLERRGYESRISRRNALVGAPLLQVASLLAGTRRGGCHLTSELLENLPDDALVLPGGAPDTTAGLSPAWFHLLLSSALIPRGSR